MGLLIAVAFVAGIVTAISPCVLPVLPIVFAGGATGGHRRPYAIVAGLVASFTLFTLVATALLSALGLPDDLLRNIAIGVVALVGLSLLWPWLGALVERPFQALGRRNPNGTGGGFLLGVSLGLLFTPCAGPVIAAVAVLAATQRYSLESVLVTLAYALGAGVVLLLIAIGAQRGMTLRAVRAHAPRIRQALGALVVAVAVVMAFGLDVKLAAHVPGYTKALQRLEDSAAAQHRLDGLLAGKSHFAASRLENFGQAPDFQKISSWINSKPLTLQSLRGKVVLIDFWTYSCVNCIRTLPYVERWYDTYRDDGLVVVGVHTPEFAFEHVRSNVDRAVKSFGIDYPVALDNDYGTWTAWGNRYWPAEYYIDRQGDVRYAHFGEGDYGKTENVIRTLLAEKDLPAPVSGSIRDRTPTEALTPETYLGSARLQNFVGSQVVPGREADYTIPKIVPPSSVAYGGHWLVDKERIVAGDDARLRLAYHARDVYLVLGGQGEVQVSVDDQPVKTVPVAGDRLYTLVSRAGPAADHTLDLSFSHGVEAYAFTFG
ncbi:MAG TPA: cytochrome c biogenesis protein DipZ [Gaiellaceae bacterium]|jgi:cytochrome c biogenesis protein CcdA/thiol-disulfide isomerase/thioredoxin